MTELAFYLVSGVTLLGVAAYATIWFSRRSRPEPLSPEQRLELAQAMVNPDTFDEETKVSPDGNLHVTSAGVWGHWTEAKAPQNYPSLWDYIRDETLD